MYIVYCGDRKIVSDAPSAQDAAAEMLDSYKTGETVPYEVRVLNILTNERHTLDTMELMNELEFEWED